MLQVLNEANLTDAILVRAVLTRSDLGKAIIDGADFSDAVLDLQQKLASFLQPPFPSSLSTASSQLNSFQLFDNFEHFEDPV